MSPRIENTLLMTAEKIVSRLAPFIVMLSLGPASSLFPSDWPMWRFGPERGACAPDSLATELSPLWAVDYGRREPVWDDPLNRDLMPYDRVFEPVVADGRMFVGFNDRDKLVALDTDSGKELWSFYAEGPVRFPAAAWGGNVYFVSDDGCLYCVRAADGALVWRFRGGPSQRRVLGNRRLISTWPARGGPVIRDGRVYFTAGIWPFMGVFIYALDARSGKVAWENDWTGSQFILQPHNSPAFAGIAPQGALVAAGDGIIAPGGRSVPALFAREDGSQRYFHLAAQNKTGGSFACAASHVFFNHYRDQVCSMYDLATGKALIERIGSSPVISGDLILFGGKTVRAFDSRELQEVSRWFLTGNFLERWLAGLDADKIKPAFLGSAVKWWVRRKSRLWRGAVLWEAKVDAGRDLIRAGDILYAASGDGITALRLSSARKSPPAVLWHKRVEGGVERLLAAGGKLFAVTLDGRIMAFGPESDGDKAPPARPVEAAETGPGSRESAGIISRTGAREGYGLVFGLKDYDLLLGLARGSNLQIVGIDPDSARVDSIRRRLDHEGLYGKRIAVVRGTQGGFDCPPYLASLIVINGPLEPGFSRLLESLRPYGGKAWLRNPGTGRRVIQDSVNAAGVEALRLEKGTAPVVVVRNGPLPGAGSWTHQYGDIANTVKSNDTRVKLPLGLLWFGGSSNLDVLPRHAHGPPEQVAGGRLFIEGIDCMSARDVYTGRVLWKTRIEGLDNFNVYYDETYKDAPTSTEYNQIHIPGANVRGANFVATTDRLYIAAGPVCRVLDTTTGEVTGTIGLPEGSGGWGYIGVCGDYLIAGGGLVDFSSRMPGGSEKPSERDKPFLDFNRSASSSLTVMNRHTGRPLWTREARYGFIHNSIVVHDGRLYCLDKLPPYIEGLIARRGGRPVEGSGMLCLDLTSGNMIWNKQEGVFGAWLSYSAEHDILLQATRPSSDMVRGEDGRRMAAYGGRDGRLLWDRKIEYGSVPILRRDRIITAGKMIDLLSGEELVRKHPLTGEEVPFSWKRNYGCNYPIACENLLTFRSAAAGYFDLTNLGGTGNLGGFKSGCTSNLVAADGVLNAPDYTRTCACSYQNQTSLALLYDRDVEVWTFNDLDSVSAPVRRVGINLGAPGDRVSDEGTLWLDYPSRGGPSPDIPVSVEGDSLRWFCHHSSRIREGEMRWVAASGVEGARKLTLNLGHGDAAPRTFKVRLYFSDCDAHSGSHVFSLGIQGKRVVERLDLVAECRRGETYLIREFDGVEVRDTLTVELIPEPDIKNNRTVICGIEAIEQGW